MSSWGDREIPEWLRLGPVTTAGATGPDGHAPQPLDQAWRAWERLRDWDRRYAFVVDTVLALALFVVSSGWLVLSDHPHVNPGFVAALTLPLIFRRRAPIAVFAVIAVVAFIQYLVTVPMVADAALLLALYTVVAESHWVQGLAAAFVLEVGVIVATVQWQPTGNDVKSFVFLSGLAFAALLAGVVVRTLRSQMGWLAERAHRLERERDQQASLAAAAERARIAREMHDVVSHNIQVMVTLADAATATSAADPPHAAEAMREVSGTGRQALLDMRRMLGVLRDDNGVAPDAHHPLAPQPSLNELEALIDRVRATGLAVEVEEAGTRFTLSAAAQLTVYRIVQEALTNSLKHATDPQRVTVAIAYDDPEVSVRVLDDGSDVADRRSLYSTGNGSGNGNGHAHAHANGNSHGSGSGHGHGVTGMAERAAAFGGTLRAGPAPDGGWQVEATLRGCKAPVSA